MLLHGCLHHLTLFAQLENPDLSLTASTDHSLRVASQSDAGDSVQMRVVYHVHKFTRLGVERSDFTVVPTGQDRFSIERECDTVALDVRYLYAQQFLSVVRIPNTDVRQRAGSEHVRVTTTV